jgi:hypothetical protein
MPRSVHLLALSSSLACSTASPPAASSAVVPQAHAAASAPTEGVPAAPASTRGWHGLTLGESDGAAVDAWVAARGLDCDAGPALARASTQVRCRDGLEPGLLPDRRIAGTLSSLLLSRPDDGRLHHVSTRRKYSVPKRAVEDYDATVAALTATFGAPDADAPVTAPERLTGPLARWATAWTRSDLVVSVSIMKAAGTHVSVTETWEVPGVEATIADRPGAGGHGASARSRNPHILSEPSAGE